jgi:MoaA/NifB/PqqE/SkfB family radical SAM enzyme
LNNWFPLIPRTVGYKLFRAFNVPKAMPFMLTVSVTNQCNSRCQTCNIWRTPAAKEELGLQELQTVFQNLGKSVIWLNLSGGEPYLKPDLVNIVKAAYECCKSKVFTIPTNGLLPDLIKGKTREILGTCKDAMVVVNVSIDGIGIEHDKIRGVKGNFERSSQTIKGLHELKKEFDNLEFGVNSVVSKFNVEKMPDIYEYVRTEFKPDSYICEPAENRSELFNLSDDIGPDALLYERWNGILSNHARHDYYSTSTGITRIIQAVRLKYYDLAVEELKHKKQIMPCYAGFASCQISPYGDVWPCCMLAYKANMGNLREFDYNFRKIWHSERAKFVRQMIKNSHCHCPMANINYTNMLCNTTLMLKLAVEILFSRLPRGLE